jgi:uncharacterized protein (DUF1330 family)
VGSDSRCLGRFLCRCTDKHPKGDHTVLIEFDSFEQALAARESEAYQEALVALSDGVERDFRIVEGID